MIPAFKKGGYDLGIASGVVQITKLIGDEYGVNIGISLAGSNNTGDSDSTSDVNAILTAFRALSVRL